DSTCDRSARLEVVEVEESRQWLCSNLARHERERVLIATVCERRAVGHRAVDHVLRASQADVAVRMHGAVHHMLAACPVKYVRRSDVVGPQRNGTRIVADIDQAPIAEG